MIDFGLGVCLRRVADDFRVLREWRNDPKIWRWTRQNDLISKSHHEDWLERQAKDATMRMYEVGIPEGMVGVCGLTSINLNNRNAEFSLYIEPDQQRKGYATKALLTLFYHGFRNMNLKQIWGETFEDNPAQEMFRKIGMVKDGRRRQFYFKDGKYCDAILFSILEHEFLIKHGERSCFGS